MREAVLCRMNRHGPDSDLPPRIKSQERETQRSSPSRIPIEPRYKSE